MQTSSTLLVGLAAGLLSATSVAQWAPSQVLPGKADSGISPSLAPHQGSAELNVYYETDPGGVELHGQLDGAPRGPFVLIAHPPVAAGQAPLGGFPLAAGFVNSDGSGHLAIVVPMLPSQSQVAFSALYHDGGLAYSHPAGLTLGGTSAPCDVLDFNYTLGVGEDAQMVAGQTISEQWMDAGIHVSAQNARALGPDVAILFDTANPTGGDDDLATPNPASVGNTTALGHVLIIAENVADTSPADGLVDVPDDEAAGGSLIFDFDDQATICSVTLIDIDEQPGTELRFYRNGDLSTPDEVISIVTLGCNSVQEVSFFEADVERFEVFFAGSGALGPMQLIPCPRVINFDETSTGIPLALVSGEWITNQFASIGVNISVVNSGGGPNKAILFDSEHPTGGDDDLLTPNPAVPGNDTPLGKILIIAENDVDVSPADGIVDDPDDEAGGGQITFAFDDDVTFISARVLDVDAAEMDLLRFFDSGGAEITSILIPDLPDGNVQLVQGPISGVRTIRLDLGGSGAVTRLRFCADSDGDDD